MMKDFFKRNLVWVAILLCIAGIVLSIIGIPTGKPIFFFIGIVLSLPTIGYLIYQVFFYHEKPEIDLSPTSAKFSSSNITSVVTNKNDVLLNDEITTDDDLEPFYDGYANDEEITKRLREVTDTERERALIDLPEIHLPEIKPSSDDFNFAIRTTTNNELLRQREAVNNVPETFGTEIPADLIERPVSTENAQQNTMETTITEEPLPETMPINEVEEILPYETNELTEPEPLLEVDNHSEINFANLTEEEPITVTNSSAEPEPKHIEQSLNTSDVIAQTTQTAPIDLTNTAIIRLSPENAAKRKQKAEEKKTLLSQANLERYIRRYFVETAACFLMDRTIYKDKNGIAPYNKLAVNKTTNLPEYTMSATKGRLYKFCTYLIDAERFITHQVLYDDFITAIEQGVSLSRISETLHPLYRKKYKKDFILNLSNREDWDNVIILVYNNYILDNDNFKDIFTRIPFEISTAYNEENVIDYLKDPDLQERFTEKYTALEEMGVPTFWEAIYICFINSIKQKLTTEQLENALLREYKKVARALKRFDNARRKAMRKAS